MAKKSIEVTALKHEAAKRLTIAPIFNRGKSNQERPADRHDRGRVNPRGEDKKVVAFMLATRGLGEQPVWVTGCPGGRVLPRQVHPRKPPPRPATVDSESGQFLTLALRKEIVERPFRAHRQSM
jgi:hypothetical protein